MILRYLILLLICPLLMNAEEGREKLKKEGHFRGGEHRPGEGRIFHFMQRLREKDPKMFEELDQLRKENMEEFRKVAKERIGTFIKEHGDFKRPKGKGPAGGERHWLRELSEKEPERYKELMQLRDENPGKFRAEMAKEFGSRMKSKPMMSKETMEGIRKLTVDYHQAEGAEKEELKASLEKALTQSFNENLDSLREVAERLEKNLAEIKNQISEREKMMSKMVEKKLNLLIEDEAFKRKKQNQQ